MASWQRDREPTRWADEEDGSEGDSDDQVKTFISPEEDGIKTVIETRKGATGQRVQITRKIKVIKKPVRKKRSVVERRTWAKFGQLKGTHGLEPKITTYTKAPVPFDLRIRKRGDMAEILEEKSIQIKSQVCTHCGVPGHWFLKCPQRAANLKERHEKSLQEEAQRGPGGGAVNPNAYVAPGRRGDGSHSTETRNGRDRDDAFTVRLNNLPEETGEQDLRDLCREFGITTRIYLAKNFQTGLNRGFAFVSYQDRESAENAIRALDRHPYGNLILSASFARDSKPKGRR